MAAPVKALALWLTDSQSNFEAGADTNQLSREARSVYTGDLPFFLQSFASLTG